jgi:hypothetical protein
VTRVELIDEALGVLRRAGVEVRSDWLDGRGSELCVVHGQRIMFMDLSTTLDEQLASLLDALRRLAAIDLAAVSPALRRRLNDLTGSAPPDCDTADVRPGTQRPPAA